MFRTEEKKLLPYYCFGILCLNIILGLPHNAVELKYVLNGGPIAWVNFEIIIVLGTYNLSQMLSPGGRILREAFFANMVVPSTMGLLKQAATVVSTLWLTIFIVAAGIIWYESSFSGMVQIWTVWAELLYSILVAFSTIVFISSIGIYRSFIESYFIYQILYFVSSSNIEITTIDSLLFLNEYPAHPFPFFARSLDDARNWPSYNLIFMMACVALFAYAYKVWREKQWYLRKA